MSKKQIDHLIKMMNQIALNTPAMQGLESRVDVVVSHIVKFWTPSMIQQVLNQHAVDQSVFSEVSSNALQTLANIQEPQP